MPKIIEAAHHLTIDCPGLTAERAVMQVLQPLSDDFTMICHADICAQTGTKRSELDLCVITPTGGLVILEVKGGDVLAREDGRLEKDYGHTTTEGNVTRQLSTQARLIKSRVHGFSQDTPFVHWLVLPHGRITGEGLAINRDTIIDRDGMPGLLQRVRDWAATHVGPGNVEALKNFLINKFTYACDYSSIRQTILSDMRNQMTGLASWVPKIRSPLPVIWVDAPAGSGKTQLAATLLKDAVNRDQKAIYVNFTRAIVERFAKGDFAAKTHFIGTWDELACEAAGWPDVDAVPEENRSAFFEDIENQLCDKLATDWRTWDVIVVDDAQTFKADWIGALGQALSETGTMYLLTDAQARLWDDRGDFVIDECVRVDVDVTVRIPQKLVEEMNMLHLTERPLVSTSPLIGQGANIAVYEGPSELLKETRRAIQRALDAGYHEDEIVVLTWRGLNSSEILKSDNIGKFRLQRPYGDFSNNGEQKYSEGEIRCDTIRRFKGLSVPYVILAEVDFDALDERTKALLYIGMSRASAQVDLIVTPNALNAITNV